MKRQTGTYVNTSTAGENVSAFVPHPLPPEPPLDLSNLDLRLLEKANRTLGRLDGLATIFPGTTLFLYNYVKKEAVLSSQIEGTQSSLSDLLLHESAEAPGVPLDDVQEVSSYVAALEHGIRRIRVDDFPLSIRLLREIHEILLSKGRGREKNPGELRRSQNWIGGTRPGNASFVPPPPQKVPDCLGELERFLHDPEIPVLIKAALAHVQLETIHPFLDGNGRLGRLLITLLLMEEGILDQPILYLSLYFKTHRQEYYEHLQQIRLTGDWEGWLRFFLQGIIETSVQAVQAARSMMALFDKDRQTLDQLGRSSASAIKIHELLRERPILSAAYASERLNLANQTIYSALGRMQELGIVREITGRQRGRLFVYSEYLAILTESTEPLPR